MPQDNSELNAAKRAYRNAKAEGNHQEEARWANVIGNNLKNRGQYVEALKWLRIDYEVTVKYLPEKHLLPSCQSLGEVYLRLEYYKDALIYQKKHLELAKNADDLVEQQRASTQLGRTYHEMFSRSEDDHWSVRNAKKYFKSAMKLAKTLKENPGSSKCSFLKEYIDAHNNLGMLEVDLDNLAEAHKILMKGLEICDEEEVIENDDGRSRLHHNLGNVYLEMRMWDEAWKHIEKDVIICNKIGHCQGEAKGYINLGELYYRVQKYDDTLLCYHKALDLAKSMEDEDALVRQVEENIETAKEAMKVMADLKKEEQNLKKLVRDIDIARGTPRERQCLLRQLASLDCLIEKARLIFAWTKNREFAKRKKRVASELCDKEKLSDSFLVIGESYQKLRKFEKAFKWHSKSLEMYKSIGNLEGQAMAKINIGGVLDYDGKWKEALNAFEESYRIAVEANLPAMQLSALENMHYCHMIRFDNIDEARRLRALIDQLKHSNKRDLETQKVVEDCCSETDTEANEQFYVTPEPSFSPMMTNSSDRRSHSKEGMAESDDDIRLISLHRSRETFSKMKASHINKQRVSASPIQVSPKTLSKSASNQQRVVGRKRVRVVLSDDEGEMLNEMELSKERHPIMPSENVVSSITLNSRSETDGFTGRFQDFAAAAHDGAGRSGECVEESTSSYKSKSDNKISQDDEAFRSSSNQGLVSESAASGSKREINIFKNLMHTYDADHLKLCHSDAEGQRVAFKIDNALLQVEVGSFLVGDKLDTESLKDELACLYYLQLPKEKKSEEGLLPVIERVSCDGRVMKSIEMNENPNIDMVNTLVEAVIHGWVSKPLIKLYINYCKELSEAPNMKLLKKLYNLECSDDEITVSECDLQDLSISPLVNALHDHKTFAVLDLSHNFLGNGTAEKIQRVFTLSGQSNDLTLDLHCNRFGPTALYQICECPVLFTRLQVLNISGNRLTDACGTYLSTILKNCKGLWSLNIERCSITSRTIQKVADALHTESTMEQLCLGYNNPISQNVLINLLVKLETLNRLTKLNLNGLKLNKPVIDSLILLVKGPRFSGLMIGDTGVGTDGALQLTESLFSGSDEFVKLDVSYCGLTPAYFLKLNNVSQIHRIHELNLAGNSLMTEGCNAVTSLLTNPHCWLKILILNNCQLGHDGVLQVIQALQENCHLEELNLANNINLDEQEHLPFYFAAKQKSEPSESRLKEPSSTPCLAMEIETVQHDLSIANPYYKELEVADSEEGPNGVEAASGIDNSCVSSCYRNPSSLKTNFFMDLLAAIELAKTLQLLDLSNNGFSAQNAENLFNTWSNSRAGLAVSHIKDKTIHLSVKGVKCCVRPCCRKE